MPPPDGMAGGEKLQAYLDKIVKRTSASVGEPDVRAGFLEGATYPDGTSVASVAFWNEFGTQRAPPRPFFRSMIREQSPTWGNKLGKILVSAGFDAKLSLTRMGMLIAGQLRRSIVAMNSPPNAPATIAAKGAAKPLVDTGHMLNSIDYEVSA